MSMRSLLKEGPKVINIGVEQFGIDLKAQGAETVTMDWRPPVAGGGLLDRLKKLKKGGI